MRVAAIFAIAMAATIASVVPARLVHAQAASATAPISREEKPNTEARYEGTWATTKIKKLDGTTNCQIKQLAKDRWQGRFWGVWQQVPFDYTVDFAAANGEKTSAAAVATREQPTGQPVRGTATIDGAHYDWVGTLSPAEFNIQFTGSRYEGRLELKRAVDTKPQR